jgi:hypothetical protein
MTNKNTKPKNRPRNQLKVARPRFSAIGDGIPNKQFMKLRYVSVGTLTTPSAAGSFATNVWASSLHDPDYTGVGHQPYYHDQLAAMYKTYRIYGFRYRLELTNGGSWGAQLYIAHKPDLALVTSDLMTEMERPTCVSRKVLPSASGYNHTVFSGYVDVAKTFGLSLAEFIADDAFFANFGASPYKQASVQFGYGMSGASTTTLDLNMTIEYDVEVFRRIDVTGS